MVAGCTPIPPQIEENIPPHMYWDLKIYKCLLFPAIDESPKASPSPATVPTSAVATSIRRKAPSVTNNEFEFPQIGPILSNFADEPTPSTLPGDCTDPAIVVTTAV